MKKNFHESILEFQNRKVGLQEAIEISESILDMKKTELSKDIWEKDKTMKTQVREMILDKLHEFIGDINPEYVSKIDKIYLVGSLCTYRYTDYADVDVTVVGNFTEDELSDILSTDPAHGGKYIAGTHPLNFFIRTSEYEIPEYNNIFDVENAAWIKFDPPEDFVIPNSVLEQAFSWSRKIDLDIGELRRDIIEYKTYTQNLIDVDYLDVDEKTLDVKLSAKIEEIKGDIDVLNQTYIALIKIRKKPFEGEDQKGFIQKMPTEDPNWSVNNIIYKVLEKFGYIDTLHRIRVITKEFEAGDIDRIVSILKV